MQRIATGDGRFAAGNPALGTPGTMVTSVYMNSLQDEICNVITEAGLELDGEDTQQLLKAITAMIFAYAPLVLPTTPSVQKTAGLIFVTDRLQFKTWVTGSNYTGYRSLNCGNIGGVMRLAPPPGMMAAEGDIFDGDDEPALVGIYKDNGLVVPVADWEPKTGMLADMGDGTYRAPDVRNMFMRFTGTDLDTANARTLGSAQLDALQNIVGTSQAFLHVVNSGNTGALYNSASGIASVNTSAGTSAVLNLNFDASLSARTSTETRGINTALVPSVFL